MDIWHSVFDNHMHLREDGYFIEAAARFRNAGGTSFNLVNLPDYSLPSRDYYSRVYERTIRMADRVRTETGIKVIVTLGPYPLDYLHFSETQDRVYDMIEKGIDLAASLIGSGKADALGEVGRPHFQVSERVLSDSNRLLEHSMTLAADAKFPVILHTEDLNQASYLELVQTANNTGLDTGKLIKHHAYPEDFDVDNSLVKSVLATRNNVREALKRSFNFMLETDYVDDREKPGKVIPPESVPKRAVMIRNQYENWEEIFQSIFVDQPGAVYGSDIFE